MLKSLPAFLLSLTLGSAVGQAPIALHPENPRYFQWRGKPTILISSAEHYGAVLNLDFDYATYLKTLASDGLNYTRIFSGAYVEPNGAFNITLNTLAPLPGKFICPWARSETPGYTGGGNKFDLTIWDEAYFTRLKDFVRTASKRGVVVEMTLFCTMYEPLQWNVSPMNFANNINHVGKVAPTDVHTKNKSDGLLPYQEALVRKIVTELNPFTNVIYEICNEPYFGGVAMDWQHHITNIIVETESALPKRHLIAQNFANKSGKIESPHPAISIFNFHYAIPEAVTENLHLKKAIGDDETGFAGNRDEPYRTEAWAFLMAGGGLFNHLDYSFAVGKENGTFEYPKTQPGGGNPGFRKQMSILRDFMHDFNFIRMQPSADIVKGKLPAGSNAWALVQPEKAIAIYLRSTKSPAKKMELHLPPGTWAIEFISPRTGKTLAKQKHTGGAPQTIKLPEYSEDLALRLRNR